jgi:hypothetical protein
MHIFHAKYPLFSSDLNDTEFSKQIFEKSPNAKLNENPSSGSRVVPRGQTDRTGMRDLVIAFRNYVNAPTNSLRTFT